MPLIVPDGKRVFDNLVRIIFSKWSLSPFFSGWVLCCWKFYYNFDGLTRNTSLNHALKILKLTNTDLSRNDFVWGQKEKSDLEMIVSRTLYSPRLTPGWPGDITIKISSSSLQLCDMPTLPLAFLPLSSQYAMSPSHSTHNRNNCILDQMSLREIFCQGEQTFLRRLNSLVVIMRLTLYIFDRIMPF